ncbi:MAG: divalent-cation tolerance protein CutA [Candidatus Helarchaeales archaeon]
MDFGVVFVTCSPKQASEIARAVVESKLAACVNVIPNVTSVYTWQGKVEEDQESLLVMKTREELFESLKEKILNIHSYDLPEIIFLPIKSGHQPYLEWISQSTG